MNLTPKYFCVSNKNLIDCKYLCWKVCNKVYFCGDISEERGVENPRILCTSISLLMKRTKDKIFNNESYDTKCSVKDKPKNTKLIEDKYILQCGIKNTNTTILMEKVAQVSIIDQGYIHKKFPSIRINPVRNLLDS